MRKNSNISSKVTPLFIDKSLPPQSLEAEEGIIGGILLEGGAAFERVKEILVVESFFLQAHRVIYQAFCELDRRGIKIDLATVSQLLSEKRKIFEQIGGSAKIAQLVDRTVSSANIDLYAKLVQEKFLRRRAIQIAHEIIDHAYASPLPTLSEAITEKYTEVTGSPLVTGQDKSIKLIQCDRLLDKINHIQLNVNSPTQKEFLLQELAKETGRSPAQLQSLFYKSLIEDEWEPTMSLAELRDKYGSDVREWLLHGFIPKGVTTLLHALGGQGKTKLIYDFIYHLALGEPWQGFPVTKKSKILIIQTDEQPTDMLNSMEIRGIRPHDPRFDISYKTRWSTDHIPQLYAEVERERYDLILIDSLASVSRFSTVSENDAEFAKPILLLNKIAADFNTAIMLIHHSSKAGDARGTTAVYNAVSQVFQLTKDPSDMNPASVDRILLIQKSRARRPAKYQLAFNPEDGSWRFDGEDTPALDVNSPLKDQIVEYLSRNRGVKFQNQDLAHNLNHNLNTVRRCLTELAADGVISAKKDGRNKVYWLDHYEENVTKSQSDQPDQMGDQLSDQFGDQFPNPYATWDRPPTDQLITKNAKFSEKNFQKNPKNGDQLISSSESHPPQAIQTDHPTDHQVITSDQVITSEQIAKGDRVTLLDGCEFSVKGDQVVEAGTILEVLAIGKKEIWANQLQVKALGDNSWSAWVPIANVKISNVCKEV